MFSASWKWLWDKHDEVKDFFRFFTKPAESKMADGQSDQSSHSTGGNGNGRNNRGYKPVQLFGLILGPVLFLLTLLVLFSRRSVKRRGCYSCKHTVDCRLVDD